MNSLAKNIMEDEYPSTTLDKICLKHDPFGTTLKVYNDGHHFVGFLTGKSYIKRHSNFYYKSNLEKSFDKYYLEATQLNLRGQALKQYIYEKLSEDYGETEDLSSYIDKHVKIKIHNFYSRLKRFKRKLYLNKWNYFTTFTFDSEKMNAETFRRKLRKCLSNLHTRHNWRYMGVFELSPEENRLHFHAIMYIPNGEMVGEIFEERSYSTKKKAMQITHINTFFQKKFGRCDFQCITQEDLKFGHTANYLTKYLNKTGEKILYSRGILSGLIMYVDKENIATEYIDYIQKYILFDDVIDSEYIYTIYRPPILSQQKLVI